MLVLALISIVLVIADLANTISIDSEPYAAIDNVILFIFAIDYFYRLIRAKNKRYFIVHNIFDLLSIIPFNSAFYLFRINRLSRAFRFIRVFKFFRVLRLTALLGRLRNNILRFLKTNGLIYLIYIDSVLLIIAAIVYSLTEQTSFWNALWWSIVTTTTVGYGDMSPSTAIGRIMAVILMFVGIGMIGMLTSAITSFFSSNEDSDIQYIKSSLDKLASTKNLDQDLTDNLIQLNTLFDQQLITKEDFETKKKQLLGL